MATVSAPPLRPPAYSLLVAVRDVSSEGVDPATGNARPFRFDQIGVKWMPALCDTTNVGPGPDICDLDNDDDLSAAPCDESTFRPFPLWAGRRVSSFGPNDAENERLVRALLAATESFQLAGEFWAGALSAADATLDNPYLAKAGAASVISGGERGVTESVGVLDRELGECLKGARGMVHVSPNLLAQWVAAAVVARSGNVWVTPLGNVVVADAGYPGTAPSGESTTAGNEWAFATGLVDVRLSEVFTNQSAFHRRSNTHELRAERLASLVWDPCCVLAVQVNPCSTPC